MQHHLVGEHHLATGLDGDVSIDVDTLAKGDMERVGHRQSLHIGQRVDPQFKTRSHSFKIAQARSCHGQAVTDSVPTTQRYDGDAADHTAFDPEVGRGARAAASQQRNLLVLTIGIALAAADHRGAILMSDAVPEAPVEGQIARVGRQHQVIRRPRAAIDSSGDQQVCRQTVCSVAGLESHRAVETHCIIDRQPFAHRHVGPIGKNSGVAWPEDGEPLALDRTDDFHLSARTLRLNHERNRNGQRHGATTERHRIGARGRANDQRRQT